MLCRIYKREAVQDETLMMSWSTKPGPIFANVHKIPIVSVRSTMGLCTLPTSKGECWSKLE